MAHDLKPAGGWRGTIVVIGVAIGLCLVLAELGLNVWSFLRDESRTEAVEATVPPVAVPGDSLGEDSR